MLLKQFVYKTIIIVLITTILCIVVFKFYLSFKFLTLYAFLPFAFGLVNVMIFKSLINKSESPFIKFTNKYLLCTTLKLLGSIIFITGFLIFYKEHAVPFLSVFLILYLIFLAQEIVEILNFFKKKSKS